MLSITQNKTRTTERVIEERSFPPITMLWNKVENKIQYIPISFERELIKYSMSMSRGIYSNGRYGSYYVNIRMDSSKNKIKSRFEILDL